MLNQERGKPRDFTADLQFLRRHTEVVLLEGDGGERVAVTPRWQGKTMTSAVGRDDSPGFGWLNHDFIASGRVDHQANLHGGEDRFWIGPEGGQFAFYFEPGRPYDFRFWRCPELIDRQSFEVLEQTSKAIRLATEGRLRNHRGAEFEMRLEREVKILERPLIRNWLKELLPTHDLAEAVEAVGHESRNQLGNVGERDWLPETGLPCIWNLGMFRPTPRTVMLLPFAPAADAGQRSAVNCDYFGPLSDQRLRIDSERGLALFVGDGQYRSKLGVGFQRARNLLGSWTPEEQRLTLVQFNLPREVSQGYCCNLWQEQTEPLSGDVVNVYNDGPNESGGILGPFYELETLSPALALRPGQKYEHRHCTLHFLAPREHLEGVASGLFGISLKAVEQAFS
ncbi:MAG: DUF6786 family protein [Planctomycetota bacterium]|jgi:hypothetical protein|nr:hypothetical protein [Blastopirellula sp.]